MQRVARVRQRQLSYLFLSYRRRQRQPMQMTVMQMTRAAIATTNMTASAASRTSGQRIFNKRPHRRGIFDGGQCNQCNVTPTSREHCSRLQQSRCQAVIGIQWSFLLHIPQQWLPMLFRGPDNRQIAPSYGGSRQPSNTWFFGPMRVSPQTASRSVHLFLYSTPVWHRWDDGLLQRWARWWACSPDNQRRWPSQRLDLSQEWLYCRPHSLFPQWSLSPGRQTHTHTYTQTTLRATPVAMGRIYAVHGMRHKITFL